MPNILFAGFALNNAGDPINGATVNLYDRNTTTPSRANTTSDANGYWAISHATEGRFDVEITSGTTKRRRKYDDSVQLETIEVAAFRIRNPADTFEYDIVPGAIVADRQLNLPVLTATDTVAVLELAQTFLTGVKTFNSSILAIRNPADTFSYTFAGGAITAARTITLPVLTGNATLLTSENPPGSLNTRVYHSANVSIADTTLTTLAWDTESFDTDTMHDTVTNNSRITFTTAGKYKVHVQVRFAANATGIRTVRIQLGGATVIAFATVASNTAGVEAIFDCSTTYDFAATNYVEVLVQQTSGAGLNVESGLGNTFFEAFRIVA